MNQSPPLTNMAIDNTQLYFSNFSLSLSFSAFLNSHIMSSFHIMIFYLLLEPEVLLTLTRDIFHSDRHGQAILHIVS